MLLKPDDFTKMTAVELPLFKSALELQFGAMALELHTKETDKGIAPTHVDLAQLRVIADAIHMVSELLTLRESHAALLDDYANLQNTLTILGELDSDQEDK